jgi:hypothetical protein
MAMDLFEWLRLGPGHWLADATEPIDHPLYALLSAVLVGVLAGALYVRLAVHTLFGGHRFKQRLAARAAIYAAWFAAAGLVIILFRWQPVPLLSKRIWLYLWFLTALGALGYAAYYSRRLYPGRLSAHDERGRRRRYLPRGAASGSRARRRARRG